MQLAIVHFPESERELAFLCVRNALIRVMVLVSYLVRWSQGPTLAVWPNGSKWFFQVQQVVLRVSMIFPHRSVRSAPQKASQLLYISISRCRL
ncbi:hypothetical protein RRG08_007954 [Elysia crispata]|uniref:Uncharacterized protein n=1 Tax=Elysia crispata TaxID=231223 RepID=A0AAE0ZQD6_9GAST|nr:hypothetical protein RRG08_007954 [Elysia crispata]